MLIYDFIHICLTRLLEILHDLFSGVVVLILDHSCVICNRCLISLKQKENTSIYLKLYSHSEIFLTKVVIIFSRAVANS